MPTPLIAEVLKIAHCRCFSAGNPKTSDTLASETAPGRSCLLANTTNGVSLNSSS